jgi:integrase
MAIYKNSKGWGVDFRDEFGRRHRRHVGTQDQARQLEAILLTQIARTKASLARLTTHPPLKLSEASQLFLNAVNTAPKTKAIHRWAHQALIRIIGDIPAAHATPQLMQRYHAARSLELAPSTLAMESSRIKALFRWLARTWSIPEGAALMLPSRFPRHSAGIYLTHTQERQALENCSQQKTRLKILLGIDAGMRSGELALLRNNSLNLPEREITVWPSKPGRTRIVPTTTRLLHELQNYTAARGANPDAPLFPCKGEKQTDPASFLAALRAKGTPPFRFHDLRHTFASRLAEIGTPTHVISALLGHTPRGTTAIYLHATRPQLHAAIQALAQFNETTTRQETNHELTKELS